MKTLPKETIIKIVLATLFIVCLFNMPYGYYELVRFVAMFGFGYLAFKHLGRDEKNIALVYLALALLFQPFFKLALGRNIWNIVDIIVAVGLLISVLTSFKKENSLPKTEKWN